MTRSGNTFNRSLVRNFLFFTYTGLVFGVFLLTPYESPSSVYSVDETFFWMAKYSAVGSMALICPALVVFINECPVNFMLLKRNIPMISGCCSLSAVLYWVSRNSWVEDVISISFIDVSCCFCFMCLAFLKKLGKI